MGRVGATVLDGKTARDEIFADPRARMQALLLTDVVEAAERVGAP
jgi:hypothetical protein